MDAPTSHRSLGERLLAALRLDPALFEEVHRDPASLGQAAAVVALAGLARGLGAMGREGPAALVAGVVGGFALWGLCTAVVWWVGVRSFGGASDFRTLLRTLGFASAPLLWLALGIVPVPALQTVVWTLSHALALVAFSSAVRHALETSTQWALWTCVLALAAGLLLLFALGVLFVGAPAAA